MMILKVVVMMLVIVMMTAIMMTLRIKIIIMMIASESIEEHHEMAVSWWYQFSTFFCLFVVERESKGCRCRPQWIGGQLISMSRISKSKVVPQVNDWMGRTVAVLSSLCSEFPNVDFEEVSRLAQDFGMDWLYLPTLKLEDIMRHLNVKGMFAHRLQLAAVEDRDRRLAMGVSFKCPHCGKNFAYQEVTDSHIAVVHPKLKSGATVKQEMLSLEEDEEEELVSPPKGRGEEVHEALLAGGSGGGSVKEEVMQTSQVRV